MDHRAGNTNSVVDAFERAVQQHPRNVALVLEDGQSFTFAVLDAVAAAIAEELACAMLHVDASHDAMNTPLVAVMMGRGVGVVASFLAVLKVGAAYVPVDPAFPPDRQGHILTHARCAVLLTDAACLEQATAMGVQLPPALVVDSSAILPDGVDTDEGVISRVLHLPPDLHLGRGADKPAALVAARRQRSRGGGLAYVLYTSGSTGQPKGVMVTHAGLAHVVAWFARELAVGPHSRVLGVTTFCFDISMLELFLPLVSGGALVLASQASQRDPFRLLDVVRRAGVTVVQATPTTYEMFQATGWAGDAAVDFLVGGEAFRPALLPLARRCRSLRNVYGPTETTIWSSCYLLPRDGAAPAGAGVPIGAPIGATTFYLVSDPDAALPALAGPGEEGELWIGGIGVAAGYLHAPDLTAVRFLPDPFSPGHGDRDGHRVYRTGDICRRTGDGSLVFVRRMDDQVKVDGFRIELAEVEAACAAHPAVAHAVAAVRGGRLAVYVIPASASTGAIGAAEKGRARALRSEVARQAAKTLPHYMVPRRVVVVASFPKTANGKLDRKALPEPPLHDDDDENDDEGDEGGEKRGAAADDTLQAQQQQQQQQQQRGQAALTRHVAAVAARLRGRAPPSPSYASFAAVGVDSLGAVLFVRALSASLGGDVRVDAAELFAPGVTVRSFAEGLYRRLEDKHPEVLARLGIPPPAAGADGDAVGGDGAPTRGATSCRRPGGARGPDPCPDVETAPPPPVTASDQDGEEGEEGDEEEDGGPEARALHASFDALVAANRAWLEGLRGACAALVLYDHFHDPASPVADAVIADTYLFIVISGLTTALQLREPPRFAPPPPTSSPSTDATLSPARALRPRRGVPTGRFLLSRAVGLFPVLWLGLLLFLPAWVEQTVFHEVPWAVRVGCPALYAVGMQSWWRPACHYYGPNSMVYASISLNCFLLYLPARRLLAAVQVLPDAAMAAAGPVCPVTLRPPRPPPPHAWRQRLAHAAVALAYSRAEPSALPAALALLAAAVLAAFSFMCYHTYAKNALFFVAYFGAGAAGASALEHLHAVAWTQARQRQQQYQRQRQRRWPGLGEAGKEQGSRDASSEPFHRAPSEPLPWPWAHDSAWVAWLYPDAAAVPDAMSGDGAGAAAAGLARAPTGNGGGRKQYHYTSVPAAVDDGPDSTLDIDNDNDIDNGNNGVDDDDGPQPAAPAPPPSRLRSLLWRFSPDALSAVVLVCLGTTSGPLARPPWPPLLLYVAVPFCVLTLAVVSCAQRGAARCNITRLVLESRPLTALGYASYPLYLFQRLALTGYLPCVYFGLRDGAFDWRVGNPDNWFERLPWAPKTAAILALVVGCWLTQRYVQDGLVAGLCARLLLGTGTQPRGSSSSTH